MTTEQALKNELTFAHCSLKFNGTAASSAVMADLMNLEVEQSLHLPSMFVIRLFNPDMKWVDHAQFKVGASVSIGMSQDMSVQPLINGEITSIEFDAAPIGRPILTLRGYDKRHRLQRGRKTRSFLQMSDSDVFSKLAKEGGLSATATSTGQVHPYLLQNNETNLEFMQRRASRLGMEVALEGEASLKLRVVATTASGVTLEYGQSLLHFVARNSSHYQVDKVVVRSWDQKTKQPLVGQSQAATGNSFGTVDIAAVYRPVETQGEAEKVAKAIHNQLKGRALQIEAAAWGDPKIVAGKTVKIKGLGTTYSKDYYVTAATHYYGADGYTTRFEASGWDSHSLLELTQLPTERGNGDSVYGTVIGIVTDNKDPEDKGRVKVKFPWLPQNEGQDIESNWARIVSPMAGASRGFFMLPEVNDEVLVSFELGDITRPYVLGAMWNGKDAPPMTNTAVTKDGKVNIRHFKTRAGHTITFNDSDDEPKIEIIDKTAKNKITIDSKLNKITVESDADIDMLATKGTVKIDAQNIVMKASQNIKSEATQNIEMKATQNIKSEATQNIEMKATMNLKAEATMNAEIKATLNLDLKGTVAAKMAGGAANFEAAASGASVTGGPLTKIQGGIVKLN